MSEAFEILLEALDEAIEDAKNPKLERQIIVKEISDSKQEDISPQSKAG